VRRVVWSACACAAMGLVLLLLQGCGPGGQRVEVPSAGVGLEQSVSGDASPTGMVSVTGAAPASGTSPSSAGGPSVAEQDGQWAPPTEDILEAFAAVREQAGEMTLYVPATLPAGATLHRCWWPASSGQEYDGQADSGEPNPHVTGAETTIEVRVLLKVAGGWVEILEGVRGDLGELPSEDIGDVAGHAARSYRLLGGYLVQWSDSGRWYAVYGRGVSADAVGRVAQGMYVDEI
jgi:hypothetical protein